MFIRTSAGDDDDDDYYNSTVYRAEYIVLVGTLKLYVHIVCFCC